MSELGTLFDRAVQAAQAPAANAIKQRMAQTAQELSNKGVLQARLDVCVAAMVNLIGILYDTEADGRPANYDPETERILVRPLPWGETGWKRWNLRKWEAVAFRRLLMDRVGDRKRAYPILFYYNDEGRNWHINAGDYPTVREALTWVEKDGPTLKEWSSIVEQQRAEANARMLRLRG